MTFNFCLNFQKYQLISTKTIRLLVLLLHLTQRSDSSTIWKETLDFMYVYKLREK